MGTPLDRNPFHQGCTLTFPHSPRPGPFRHAVHLTCISLGCGRKPEYREKPTQTWGGRAHCTATVAPAGNQLVFFSSSTLNKTMLFEDLLYTFCETSQHTDLISFCKLGTIHQFLTICLKILSYSFNDFYHQLVATSAYIVAADTKKRNSGRKILNGDKAVYYLQCIFVGQKKPRN